MIERRWQTERVIDLFDFTETATTPSGPNVSAAEAEVAWFDRDDRLVEAPVQDLGAILRALEPVPDSIPYTFTFLVPPVRITGRSLRYQGTPPSLDASATSLTVGIWIAIHSDIWFPFVFGSAHPWADHKQMFDNRPLATRHTPRLDAFLGQVGEAVRARGGTWRVVPRRDRDRRGEVARRPRDPARRRGAGAVSSRRLPRRVVLTYLPP